MKKHGFDEDRLCRINGQKPNARERWMAFWRLWRITQNAGMWQSQDANECFRILWADWRMIRCADATDGDIPQGINMTGVPDFLRKQFLKLRKNKRLYGNHWEWKEQDKIVANQVCNEQGVEVTPTEVAETRRKLINHIRHRASVDGIRVPQDDDDLLLWLKKGNGK